MPVCVVSRINSDSYEIIGDEFSLRANSISELVRRMIYYQEIGVFKRGVYTGAPIEDETIRKEENALSPAEHKEFWRYYYLAFIQPFFY